MTQGTTPEFVFELPFSTDNIKNAKVIFASYGGTKLEKQFKDCHFEGNKITVKLTQSETFRFDCTKSLNIQLRILTHNDEALLSNTFVTDVCKCFDNEVLS